MWPLNITASSCRRGPSCPKLDADGDSRGVQVAIATTLMRFQQPFHGLLGFNQSAVSCDFCRM